MCVCVLPAGGQRGHHQTAAGRRVRPGQVISMPTLPAMLETMAGTSEKPTGAPVVRWERGPAFRPTAELYDCRKRERTARSRDERLQHTSAGVTGIHLFPTNYGRSAYNSVKVQPISTVRKPNHARTAAEMPNGRNCLHYFRTACTAA